MRVLKSSQLGSWCVLGLVLTAFLVSVVAQAKPYHRRFKYTLDPSQAEQIIGRIPLTERLDDDKWLGLVGERKAETYKVRLGDNLWRLSGRFFKNPWLWRKFWQVNPTLGNPHEIEVGMLLNYYREPERGIASQQVVIPVIKLLPSNVARDLDEDSVVNLDIKNQFVPPFIVMEDEQILGSITGSYSRAKNLKAQDEVFIKLNDGSLPALGTVYSIIKRIRDIEETVDGSLRKLGQLVSIQGDCKVIALHEDYAQIRITRHKGRIERGNELILPEKPVSLMSAMEPPNDFTARIVMGEPQEKTQFGTHEIVLLNKGTVDGMQKGYLFRVNKDEDPETETKDGVAPSYKGEIQVVYAGRLSSIGYVTRSRDPLEIGDRLEASQNYSAPFNEKLPHPKAQEIE